MFHLSSFVRQFRPSYVGRGAKTKVVSGDEKLDKLRGHFYVSQMFGSPSSKLLEPSSPMLHITVLAQRNSWAEYMVAILY